MPLEKSPFFLQQCAVAAPTKSIIDANAVDPATENYDVKVGVGKGSNDVSSRRIEECTEVSQS